MQNNYLRQLQRDQQNSKLSSNAGNTKHQIKIENTIELFTSGEKNEFHVIYMIYMTTDAPCKTLNRYKYNIIYGKYVEFCLAQYSCLSENPGKHLKDPEASPIDPA